MSSRGLPQAEWQAFREKVAALSEIRADQVDSDTRLIEDLGLDSLALVELVVMLIDEYGMVSLFNGLETRSWTDTTVGRLFAEASQPVSSP